MADDVVVLAYAGCSTCKNALRWLENAGIGARVRPIVDEPPTAAELRTWIPASGIGVRKWLNTSGQSYRAIGKEKMDAASDADVARWLTEDGKLVKRPVLVRSGGDPRVLPLVPPLVVPLVLVGFKEAAWRAAFAR